MTLQDQYRSLLIERAFRVGDFVLTSGKRSPHFIDMSELFNGRALRLLGKILHQAVSEVAFEAIGGPGSGAISLTAAYLLEDAQFAYNGHMAEGFTVRSTKRPDGDFETRVEGRIRPRERVVILEDVVTTGGSVLRAAEAVEAVGGVVVKIVAVVDRDEGGREAIAKRRYLYSSVFTLHDLLPKKEKDPNLKAEGKTA